jgi:ketosteroid isomerase-like protein
MSHLANVKKLYQMMGTGQMMEAFEELYHEEVVVKEPNGEVREGKEAQREAIKGWQASIKEFHGSGEGAITSNEETGETSVESWFDITFQDGNRVKMQEVGIQKWKDGKIIEERFYYNMPPQQ